MKADVYGNYRGSAEGRATQRKANWVEGWWENIAPNPVYIRDKHHLKQVCEAESRRTGRIIIPKAFMKPKSQGKGYEWSF